MPYLTMRDGAQVYVRDIGQGQPVLLLHGFGSDGNSWLPFALPLTKPPFAGRYRFILPDLRGFGRSHNTNYNQASALDNYLDDLSDILDGLGLDKVLLGGLSMGALTSMLYLQRDGSDRVIRYLNIDQAPKPLNDETWQWGLFGNDQQMLIERFSQLLARSSTFQRSDAYDGLPADYRQQMREGFGEFFSYAVARKQHKVAAKMLMKSERVAKKVLPTSNWYAYVDCLTAYLQQDYDARAIIPELDIPMTVMVGMRSPMYPPKGQFWLHQNAPNSTVVEFARAGHAIPLSQPLKFGRELHRFLAA